MSDDQFTQIMQRFASMEARFVSIEMAVAESNAIARQALSIANGTDITLMILFDNVDKRLKAIEGHLFPAQRVN